MADTNARAILWILFLATALTITIVLVAFVVAMVLAQRERNRLRQQQALLVARAHEEERAWVASELHDDVLQRIALSRAEIESLGDGSEPAKAGVLSERLGGISAELVDLAVAVRRIAARLHPTVVDQVGLLAALDALKEEVQRGSPVRISISANGSVERIPPESARAAYRIVQESLRNVVRHSGSPIADVTIEVGEHEALVLIRDAGRGFDLNTRRIDGLGIASLRERALIVGGTADVRSRPGSGTVVTVRLPLASA